MTVADDDRTANESRVRRNNRLWLALGAFVGLSLVVRTCCCEAHKIPATSMLPTLHRGDHIVTVKVPYGWRLPFTDIGGTSVPARGDVIVFRYPIERSEDFIKRVIGVPGDEIRLVGDEILLKRAGEAELAEILREPVSEPCLDETGTRSTPNCTVFIETLDDRTYLVQYIASPTDDERGLLPEIRTFVVPEGHLFVLGDNRNRSHDSPQWTDPTGEPHPYVPIEDVKGRARRVWLPFSRFWTPIR